MWIEIAVLLIFCLFGIGFLIWDYADDDGAASGDDGVRRFYTTKRSSLDKFI